MVTGYAVEFPPLTADSQLNAAALADAFFQGLSGRIKDHVVSMDVPEELDSLIAMPIKINKRLTERDQERGRLLMQISLHLGGRSTSLDRPSRFSPFSTSSTPSAYAMEEPAQLGITRLPCKEHLHWQDRRCFCCGLPGHQVSTDPTLPSG